MAESFATTNRFLTTNITLVVSHVTVILLLKKLNFLSIMVTLLMSWTWQSVNPLRKKSVCLLRYAVVCVSHRPRLKKYGQNT